MVWAKFDDGYPFNKKIRKLTDAQFRLDVSGICWAAQHDTNGFIDVDDIDIISDVRNASKVVEGLVTRRRWERVDGGWQIHDYLVYNPSAEKVRKVREARAKAGSLGGRNSSKSKANLRAVGDTDA